MDAVSGSGGVFRSAVYWVCLKFEKRRVGGPNYFNDICTFRLKFLIGIDSRSLPIPVVLVKIVIVSAVYHGSQEQK